MQSVGQGHDLMSDRRYSVPFAGCQDKQPTQADVILQLQAGRQFIWPFPLFSGPVHKYSLSVPPWETPSLTKAVPLGPVTLGGEMVTI